MRRFVYVVLMSAVSIFTWAAPVPRDTEAAMLERLFGKPDVTAKECEFRLDQKVLEIRVPGTVNASAVSLADAPRTVREVRGNFAAEVSIRYLVPAEKANGHCGAGIAVWVNDKEYALINRHHWPAGEGKEWSGGFDTHMHAAGAQTVSHGATCPETTARSPGRLRIRREKQIITSEYTLDNGKTWNETGRMEVSWPETIQLGVVAHNTTGKPVVIYCESLEVRELKK